MATRAHRTMAKDGELTAHVQWCRMMQQLQQEYADRETNLALRDAYAANAKRFAWIAERLET